MCTNKYIKLLYIYIYNSYDHKHIYRFQLSYLNNAKWINVICEMNKWICAKEVFFWSRWPLFFLTPQYKLWNPQKSEENKESDTYDITLKLSINFLFHNVKNVHKQWFLEMIKTYNIRDFWLGGGHCPIFARRVFILIFSVYASFTGYSSDGPITSDGSDKCGKHQIYMSDTYIDTDTCERGSFCILDLHTVHVLRVAMYGLHILPPLWSFALLFVQQLQVLHYRLFPARQPTADFRPIDHIGRSSILAYKGSKIDIHKHMSYGYSLAPTGRRFHICYSESSLLVC
jgi:hypothetical protein